MIDVSIVILNHNRPEIIEVCLTTLQITEGVTYEVIVVDNGSNKETIQALQKFSEQGLIDKLILEKKNHWFAEGNNIGVRNSDPSSEFILLLNSDVGFLRPDWLQKVVGWANGSTVSEPTVWGLKPTIPRPGPRDIVSVGWSHDAAVVPGNARPEGWCCLIRRKFWKEISTDFPWHYGLEEMLCNAMRNEGAKMGVLSQYAPYMVHAEGMSRTRVDPPPNKRTPDLPGWMSGLYIETLDFTLGPDEHLTYMKW